MHEGYLKSASGGSGECSWCLTTSLLASTFLTTCFHCPWCISFMCTSCWLITHIEFDKSYSYIFGLNKCGRCESKLLKHSTVLEKQEKLPKNSQTCNFLLRTANFWQFFMIFSRTVTFRGLWFFVLRSVSTNSQLKLTKTALKFISSNFSL